MAHAAQAMVERAENIRSEEVSLLLEQRKVSWEAGGLEAFHWEQVGCAETDREGMGWEAALAVALWKRRVEPGLAEAAAAGEQRVRAGWEQVEQAAQQVGWEEESSTGLIDTAQAAG